MKKLLRYSPGFLLCLLSMAFLTHVQAQTILYITPGTALTISPGTNFCMDLLSLTPSSGFTLNGQTMTENTTLTNNAANTYISRVYLFSGATGSFTGDIQFGYQDGELNGLPEANLELNVFDGTSWQAFPASTNNLVSNFVVTPLSNVPLNELTLASVSNPLPLRWGAITAYRRNSQLFIDWETLQEYNVGYFTVEKSFDGSAWSPIIQHIPATNKSLPQQYQQTDPVYSPLKVFYRIREVDIDDRSAYSTVAVVSAENSSNAFIISPNPATDHFYINGGNRATLKQVQLFSSSGLLVRTWQGAQSSYSVDLPAAGVYFVRLTKTDGTVQYETLVKK